MNLSDSSADRSSCLFLRQVFKKLFCSVSVCVSYSGDIYLSKALIYMKLFLYKQKCFFIKETDIFGHIVEQFIHLT